MNDQNSFEQSSLWRVWCIGIVAQDKPFGIDTIVVSPMERIPDQMGVLGEDEEEFTGKAPSTFGQASEQELKGSSVLQAMWAPDGDNHLFTSPMVRKGETVKLYKYADQDKVFWTTMFREPSIRRTERFIFAAGNLSGGTDSLDLDSTYYIDFDTLSKAITIQTAVSDGERFRYRFTISPRDSSVMTEDNVGNKIILSSQDNNVYMEDASGGKVETRDGHPRIYGPKGVLIETPAEFNVKSGNTKIEGSTVFTDDVNIQKTLAVAGGSSLGYGGGAGSQAVFGGSMTINGSLTVSGTANFPGGHGPH